MKKTKSTLTLRNLAMSIKKSIQLDQQKIVERQFVPFRSSKSVTHCMPKERNRQKDAVQRALKKQQKENKVFVLERQIACLEKQITQFQSKENNQSKELYEYDQLQKQLILSQKEILLEKQNSEEIRNQILMLQEDIMSSYFNMQCKIAEKQYHEEIIDTYGSQFEAQSKLVFKIFQLQAQKVKLNQGIIAIEEAQSSKSKQFQEWKDNVKYSLNQHKLKNNIKNIKTKLIELQDQCDQFCSLNHLRKIRQLYCLYFKNYSRENEIFDAQTSEGIDIFICKKRLCDEFSQFLRQRLVYNKPRSPLIDDYISTLLKMQEIYSKSPFEHQKKTFDNFVRQLQDHQSQKIRKRLQMQQKEEQSNHIINKLDELFNLQSIALIEFMREKNQDTYDLNQIKRRLRQGKKEQSNRIKMIKLSLKKINELELSIEKSVLTSQINKIKEQIQDLSENIISSELHLSELQRSYFGLLKSKNKIEDRIHEVLSRLRLNDQKKDKLKLLYKQYEAANNWQRSALKCQSLAKQLKQSRFRYSENTSLSSLRQSKPILSLSHPYRKLMERPEPAYQPLISNCQMVLSSKLANNDTQFRCYQSKEEKVKHVIKKERSKGSLAKQSIDKENKRASLTAKKLINPALLKGNQTNTQRQSLSRLLISKFNR